MSGSLPPGETIGIIGGGQLGRMLAMAAARLGYQIAVIEPQADCPAAQVANTHIAAPYDDPAALARLAGLCAVVTYEFENVPLDAAHTIADKTSVYPPPRALEAAQDRLTEKRFLNAAGIETAPFAPVDSDEDLARALDEFGGNGVLKTRRMGYDGKGQRVFRDAKSAETAGIYVEMGSVPLILEGFVPFGSEISVIAARGTDGAVSSYEPSRNEHRDGILRTSTVPAGVREATTAQAGRIAATILEALDYAGVVGVEFFVLSDGALLVNEIAPRVHNSGHWTEAACAVSQFEQHIRAIAGLPLGNTERHSDCVMENLIGADIERLPALLEEPDTVIHLYGKKEMRPGRKMGHVTRLQPRS